MSRKVRPGCSFADTVAINLVDALLSSFGWGATFEKARQETNKRLDCKVAAFMAFSFDALGCEFCFDYERGAKHAACHSYQREKNNPGETSQRQTLKQFAAQKIRKVVSRCKSRERLEDRSVVQRLHRGLFNGNQTLASLVSSRPNSLRRLRRVFRAMPSLRASWTSLNSGCVAE